MTRQAVTWTVGRGGLLGRAVERAVGSRGPVWAPPRRFSWTGTAEALDADLETAVVEFADHLDGRPWQVAWCAGAGVTGTSAEELAGEVEVLTRTLDRLASHTRCPGTVFLASSAGGVYAGARASPPFTEDVPPRALAPYGQAKLDAESTVRRWAARTGGRALVGRIANLYGPGQNLVKPQGLVSQFCRAHLTGQPLSVYVPLDTVRDYLFVEDCGAMVGEGLGRLGGEDAGTTVTKILASQWGVTIGTLLGEMRRVFKRAPRIVLGASPAARYQARDLRFRSVVWPELDHRVLTPLPVGVAATLEDLKSGLRSGALSGARLRSAV